MELYAPYLVDKLRPEDCPMLFATTLEFSTLNISSSIDEKQELADLKEIVPEPRQKEFRRKVTKWKIYILI